MYSSSHPSHVKNSIPYSQFLRLRRLCSEDSDFSFKSEEMCNFFDKRGYPASVVQAGHHRAQQIDRQSALQTSQKENNNRIPFTLTFHPHNHAVKSIILKNIKLLQNDPDTGRIFSQPPLISFKRDKSIKTLLNRLLDTLICRIILSNIWQSAVSPYIKEAQKAAKLLNKDLFFISALLILTVSTKAFHSTNSFCCFSRCQAPTNSVAPYFCI